MPLLEEKLCKRLPWEGKDKSDEYCRSEWENSH